MAKTDKPPNTSPFHEDPVAGKTFDRGLFGRLVRYASPYRWQLVAAFGLIVLGAGLGLVGPILIRDAIDGPLREAIASGVDESSASARSHLYWLAGAFVIVALTLLVVRFYESVLMAWIGQKVMLDLRREVFRHILRMPLAFFDRNPIGRLVTRVSSDIEALNELFASGIVAFLADLFVLVAITIALVWVNWTLALVTLGALPLLLIATMIFRTKARKYYREQRSHLSHLNAFTQESIQGMTLVQAFRRERRNQDEYEEINDRYKKSFLDSVRLYAIYFPVVELFEDLALAAIIWTAGSQMSVLPPTLTFGNFFLFWHFLGRFFQPIRDMAERYNILQSAMAAAERIFQVLDTPETLRDPEVPRPIARVDGRVEFSNVWFAYNNEEWALRDVSFTVEPGQMVAIVGATGAGKSTIISLLSRFYDPQRGAIRVDGVDVREHRKRDLRAKIAIVLQDVFIFSRTVRENIQLDSEAIRDEDVEAAVEAVNARRFVERLPGGLDAKLEERGATLSVGERQLLSFARALAHDPKILVLDEATSNVDSETEALVQDALTKLLAGRTSIVIAHRLSTIRRADKIIVLHKGEVREVGSHAELFQRDGIYRRLCELQWSDAPGAADAGGAERFGS
jgi:ATP-binding cassette subfamily B multidrug efflux pump